jgi:hypothetical protein
VGNGCRDALALLSLLPLYSAIFSWNDTLLTGENPPPFKSSAERDQGLRDIDRKSPRAPPWSAAFGTTGVVGTLGEAWNLSRDPGCGCDRSSTDLFIKQLAFISSSLNRKTHRLPVAYPSNIGLGSVGLEILCFLAPALPTLLVLPSPDPPGGVGEEDDGEGTLDADAERTNHDFGFAKNWARPDEGDAERDDGGLGARGSAGGASALGDGAPLRRFMTA